MSMFPHSNFSLSKEGRMQIEGIGKRCRFSSEKDLLFLSSGRTDTKAPCLYVKQ